MLVYLTGWLGTKGGGACDVSPHPQRAAHIIVVSTLVLSRRGTVRVVRRMWRFITVECLGVTIWHHMRHRQGRWVDSVGRVHATRRRRGRLRIHWRGSCERRSVRGTRRSLRDGDGRTL